ncbi:MAG: T9SS type A sorting domain-containing protein [Ignavibacteria bacterium]|nr:T9SS type A sorting domain-containing protein [Ignavibacteria bacterium]
MRSNNSLIRYYLIVNFLLFSAVCIYAQPTEQWVNRYNSPSNSADFVKSMTVDNSGNIIVTGNAGNTITTIKYSPAGAELWVKTHSAGTNNTVYDIVTDNSGNIIITGEENQGSFNMLTIKYDPAGNVLWLQRYNGPSNMGDFSRKTVCDVANNIFITGFSETSAATNDLVTIKYNPSGILQWVNNFGVSVPDIFDMKLDPTTRNIYVCGALSPSTNGVAFLEKIPPTGIMSNLQIFDYVSSDGYEAFTSLAVNNAGTDIYVTGRSWSGPAFGDDYITVKYNSSLFLQWSQRYNGLGSGMDIAHSLVIDNNENVYSAGFSDGGASALFDVAIAKYSTLGVPLGFQRYNTGQINEVVYKMKIDPAQNIYLTGMINNDVLLLKYNNALTLQWAKTYNSPANEDDSAVDIMLANTGDIYLAGTSRGIGTGNDFLTIKYSQTVGIVQISADIPKAFALSQNYPNPFNPETNIRFDIPNDADVKIVVYDMLGRVVQLLADEFKQAGSYEVSFDASAISSGTYFYKITAGNFTDIKKMVLIK